MLYEVITAGIDIGSKLRPIGRDQDKALFQRPLLDSQQPLDCLLGIGITTQPEDRFGGIGNDTAVAQ